MLLQAMLLPIRSPHLFVRTNVPMLKHSSLSLCMSLSTIQRIHEIHPQLNRKSEKTLNRVFEHPISHNLFWHDTQALLENLGASVDFREDGPAGAKAHVSLNHVPHTFPHTHPGSAHNGEQGKAFTEFEVMELRRWLTKCVVQPAEAPDTRDRIVVVVDHTHADVYNLNDSIRADQQKLSMVAKPSQSTGNQCHHEQYHYARGVGRNDRPHLPHNKKATHTLYIKDFCREIEAACAGADQVVVIGHGSGSSDCSALLLQDMQYHTPALFSKVRAKAKFDFKHTTEKQLLQYARRLFDESDNHWCS